MDANNWWEGYVQSDQITVLAYRLEGDYETGLTVADKIAVHVLNCPDGQVVTYELIRNLAQTHMKQVVFPYAPNKKIRVFTSRIDTAFEKTVEIKADRYLVFKTLYDKYHRAIGEVTARICSENNTGKLIIYWLQTAYDREADGQLKSLHKNFRDWELGKLDRERLFTHICSSARQLAEIQRKYQWVRTFEERADLLLQAVKYGVIQKKELTDKILFAIRNPGYYKD